MDLLEDRQLVNTGLELVHERMLVNAVLVQALKAVQFHHIEMSKQLREFFVLVTEHAHLTELTVFTIVEGPALGGSGLLLTMGMFRLLTVVLVRTVLTKSARASLDPVETRFSPWCLSRLMRR